MSIYQEIITELQAIAAEVEEEGYTDFEQVEYAEFITEEFNSVFEGRN